MSRRLPVLLSADSEEAGAARPVRLIAGDAALEGRAAAWATANGFKGQKGRLLLCPDDAGEIAEALFGIGKGFEPMALRAL
ncbi:MAG: leucyl aminopeptidase family protein, partial [Brevundimonas sp.]|nr:leucyl aminopeptidase family protein [Brevundimonas sp.]